MQPSPLATGSPLGSQPLGDAGKKGRGKKKKKEKLKNIPVQRGYFGIFIYYLKKKGRNESRGPTASSGVDGDGLRLAGDAAELAACCVLGAPA